ncbi:MAG TPA: ATP-binding protein [Candidatus Limnocylindria bacterium]|nr:ATP-binding protein [Candidatus Limnocylindria bacterium]
MSIRLRLTAWYVLTLTIALGAVAFALVLVFRTAMERQVDDELAARAAQISSTLQADAGGLALQGQGGDESLVVGGEFIGLYDASGKLVDSSATPPKPADALASLAVGSATARSQTLTSGAERLRIRAVPVAEGGRRIGTVAVVRSLAPLDAAVGQLLGILGLALPLAVAIAAIGGYLLAYRALRPVEQLRRAAEDYGANDLSGRLAPPELRDDELGRLARTLDAMLDRVAAAVEQQRRFTGDASHELRTPIATILADASLSLERSRSAEDHRATIARIESEAARMGRIVEGLLVLARADARSAPKRSEDVDVRSALEASVHRVARDATERGVRIEARLDRALVVADRDNGLERVFDNLLDNALRYAPRGSVIEIETEARGGMARVTVADHGPGIAPDERTRVFERFHRGPGSSGPGAGLGLAIASAIVEADRGRISVVETPGGGATFVVELPTVDR